MHLGVAFRNVMHVVGGYAFDAYLAGKLHEQGIDFQLLFKTVILKLDIEIPFAEHVFQA